MSADTFLPPDNIWYTQIFLKPCLHRTCRKNYSELCAPLLSYQTCKEVATGGVVYFSWTSIRNLPNNFQSFPPFQLHWCSGAPSHWVHRLCRSPLHHAERRTTFCTCRCNMNVAPHARVGRMTHSCCLTRDIQSCAGCRTGGIIQKLLPTNVGELEQRDGRGSDPILALKIKAFKIKESLDSVGTWKDD